MPGKESTEFPPELFELYDRYVHGGISRREFLDRAARFAGGALGAAALLEALSPDYALARQVPPDDPSLRTGYVTYPSPQGHGEIRAYLARPAEVEGPLPGVVVVHENRGLNPYIEDVARRLGRAGFLALAPDGLTPAGGYPGDDDRGRELQAELDREKLVEDFIAAVPFYGGQPPAGEVGRIRASLLIHYAEEDPPVNAGWPEYEEALEAHGVDYEVHFYPDTLHGFHNDTTPRYDESAAELAWKRTVRFLGTTLRER